MSKRETRYIKLAKTLLKVLGKCRVPRHFSKFSNKLYTSWQHFVLLVLRQHENKSYRRFCDWMEECTNLLHFLGLERVPHFTTLEKFAKRIKTTLLGKVLNSFISLTMVEKMVVGVDSTGFSPTRASYHYIKRMGKAWKRKKYLKSSISVELRKQVIISGKVRRGPANDNLDLPSIIRKAAEIKPIKLFIGDRGYDSEANHKLIREELKANSIIPARNKEVPLWRTRGKYRKQMKKGYSLKEYHQRSKNETVFSVIKRLFGESINSRLVGMQNKELILRQIAYNTHRTVNLLTQLLRVSTKPIDANLNI